MVRWMIAAAVVVSGWFSAAQAQVFVAGQDVRVPAPAGAGTWVLLDYDGREVASGEAQAGKPLDLGKLPVGHYELRRQQGGDGRATSLGVIAPLAAPTPDDSPIGLDGATAWFYGTDRMEAVATLCRLAGVRHVRDRLAWGEVEPRRGELRPRTKYDASAEAMSAAGLRVLQVNHSSPGWANPDGKRFPLDLRDAYAMHKALAARWKGKVHAFEPWNEADIEVFGGHTGAEMASMQKASYLGIKAGNPDAVACMNVFAHARKATLDDLVANEAWPYFDTMNLHHYIPLEQQPAWYAAFRAASAGRPLWVTECSMPVKWADEKTKEPSAEDLKVQAERVPMTFAASLHEGSEATFYFLLPHYVEGQTQFGILRRDLTPRPAFVALANVGRMLAGARPLGRWAGTADRTWAFAFDAKIDGRPRRVLVAWSFAGAGQKLDLPAAPLAVTDHLGRPVRHEGRTLPLSRAPLFVTFDAATTFDGLLTPPPARPPRQEATPSPVVLQSLWPKDKTDVGRSAYKVAPGKEQALPIFVYNFSDRPAKGTLTVAAPPTWTARLDPAEIDLAPMSRRELTLTFTPPPAADATTAPHPLRITGSFAPAPSPILSVRLLPTP